MKTYFRTALTHLCFLVCSIPAFASFPAEPELACKALLAPRTQIISTDSLALVVATLRPEDQEFVNHRGPYQKATAVKLVDGEIVAYGSEIALRYAKDSVGKHRDVVIHVGGDELNFHTEIDGQRVTIKTVPALTGSAVRSDDNSDVDVESTILVEYDSFREADLHRADSIAGRALVQFFQHYLKMTSTKYGYKLTDFKAGEYDFIPESAQRTKSRAVKWTAAEVADGTKSIRTANGRKKNLSLSRALTTEARLKVDWAIDGVTKPEVEAATGIHRQKIDANVLFLIGGRSGNKPPVMRIAYESHLPEPGATGGHLRTEGTAHFSPLRLTTIFYKPEHASLARKLSITTPPPNIIHTHAHLLTVTNTYRDLHQYYKVLRRLSQRLNYWNDVPVFSAHAGSQFTAEQIQRDIAILTDSPEVHLLHHLRVALDLQQEPEFVEKMIAFLRARYSTLPTPLTIEQIPSLLDQLIEDRVQTGLQQMPHLKRYIDYVLNSVQSRTLEPLQDNPTFITYRPDRSFVRAARRTLEKWRIQYPQIAFSNIDDLHMTIAFNGLMNPTTAREVQKIFERYSDQFAQVPFSLEGGSLGIVGKNNAQLAIVFNRADLPQNVLDLIQRLKFDLVNAGIRPDRHLTDFLPHISLAHIRDTFGRAGGQASLHQLLSNEHIPVGITRVKIDGHIYHLSVNPGPVDSGRENSRYSALGTDDTALGGISSGEVSSEDLDE